MSVTEDDLQTFYRGRTKLGVNVYPEDVAEAIELSVWNEQQILPSFDATMPANAPVPVGFDATQTAAILAAGS